MQVYLLLEVVGQLRCARRTRGTNLTALALAWRLGMSVLKLNCR